MLKTTDREQAGNTVVLYLLMSMEKMSDGKLHCDTGTGLPLAVGHKYLLFVRPMEYMDLYQRTLPCREYQATTNATDATLYSFCLDRTQTRPLPFSRLQNTITWSIPKRRWTTPKNSPPTYGSTTA